MPSYNKAAYIGIWAAVFIIFTLLTVKGVFVLLDSATVDILKKIPNPLINKLCFFMRSRGDFKLSVLLGALTAIYAFFKDSKRIAILFLILFFLLVNVEDALKAATKRERPTASPLKTYSYPSGHSNRSAFIFLFMAHLVTKARLSKKVKKILSGTLYALILLVGFSSIYLGFHWLSDIIGAYILAYIGFLILLALDTGIKSS